MRLPASVRAICLVVLAGGCAVGPDFHRPPPPAVTGYTATPTPDALVPGFGEPEQRFVGGDELSADWWELFRSAELSEVVREAIAGNQTLAAAEATLARAQDALAQARAAFYPQVSALGNAERQKTALRGNTSTQSPAFNLFSVGPTVSYSPDVFGGTRRQVEQQAALAESERYQLGAAYLTLTGNVVSQAIGIAGTRLEIAATEEIIADDEKNLDLVRTKFEAGKAAQTDVLTAESQLMNDRALLPPLRQQLSVANDAMSILLGRFPAQWMPPQFDLEHLALPGDLPVTLSSDLVHQRPDILASEASLHAASAAIGVATAQMYPSITLSASVGLETFMSSGMSAATSEMWNIASGITAPIFEGGALVAQKQGAIDAFRGSLATYQQTVLQAFGQVAATLQALAHDSDLVAAARHALDVADSSLALQRLSYQAGKSDVLLLVESQRLDQQARLGYARAQTQRYQDTAQLFVAMGGRWWTAGDIAPDKEKT
ncbi:MAG TPA: efflux transporter outer membrane subunit [Candidatus Binatia bacterium]|nr:efflux transporter outer membrane subunit [Candidatus Binatia bacterium]